MEIAKVFYSGNSQSVRLPKGFRFTEDRVYIKRVGNAVILIPFAEPWRSLLDSLDAFSPDFLASREQGTADEREGLFE